MRKLIFVLLLASVTLAHAGDTLSVGIGVSTAMVGLNTPVTFTGTYTSSAGTLSWSSWNFGDGVYCYSPICGLTLPHTFTKIGTFVVTFTVADTKGQVQLVNTTINVVETDKVTATLSLDPNRNLGQLAVEIFLAASSTQGMISTIQYDCGNKQLVPLETYAWQPPDGTNFVITGFNAVSGTGHMCYYIAGTYTASVTVTDSLGQSATSSIPVIVK